MGGVCPLPEYLVAAVSAPLPLTAVQVADADFLRAKRKRAGLRTAPKASWKRGVKRQLRGGRLKFTPAREPSRGGTNKEVQGWGLGFGVKVGNHQVRPYASASPLLLRCPPEPSDAGGSCCPGRTSRHWGCSCGYLGGGGRQSGLLQTKGTSRNPKQAVGLVPAIPGGPGARFASQTLLFLATKQCLQPGGSRLG